MRQSQTMPRKEEEGEAGSAQMPTNSTVCLKLKTMKKITYLSLALSMALAVFSGCQKGAEHPDVLLVTGTETNPLIKFPVETANATYPLTVTATTRVNVDTDVTFGVDKGALDEYNRQNGTNYLLAPDESYSLTNTTVTIKANKHTSTAAMVKIENLNVLEEGLQYVIPVSIKTSTGQLNVLDAGRTGFLRIARVTGFTCVDVTPTGNQLANAGYRTYYFDEPCDLSQFSFEMKIYIDEWHTGLNSTQITRLANWGPGDDNPFGRTGSSMNLLRIGEGGYAKNQLQWLHSQGGMGSNIRFDLKTWYLLTFTYDGFTYRFYVNGKLDNVMDGAGKLYFFDSFEIGMSWNDGSNHSYSQRIPGRMSEIRVWDRPLKAKEIAAGLCGVAADSPGLIAYWKMNEGEGAFYRDYSGHGRDLDFNSAKSVSVRDGTSERQATKTPFRWITDDENKCAQ